jgi:hypothetical protein
MRRFEIHDVPISSQSSAKPSGFDAKRSDLLLKRKREAFKQVREQYGESWKSAARLIDVSAQDQGGIGAAKAERI